MIRVAIKSGLLGEGPIDWHELPWRDGITLGELRGGLAHVLPANIVAGFDGRRIDDAAEIIPDGSTVVVIGATGETVIGYVVYAVIAAVVSLAVNYVVGLLFPPPKPPGVPQERGDEASVTYSWDSIQTSYGQGMPIGVVFGRHAVGGQVISSRVLQQFPTFDGTLGLVVALSEGPVFRVGQYPFAANLIGENGQGFLEELYINDTLQPVEGSPNRGFVRVGTFGQSPLPAEYFPGASSLFLTPAQLNAADDEFVWTYSGTDAAVGVAINLRAAGGVYQILPGGGIQSGSVSLDVSWRLTGEATWRPLSTFVFVGSPDGSGTTRVRTFQFEAAGIGPLEVRLRRITPAGDVSSTVNQLTLRTIELLRPQEFSYPGIAILGLLLPANAQLSGTQPRIRTRVDGVLLRVWDATHGFSARVWDPPTEPNFSFAVTVGRNPAWILGEFATNKRFGLGNELTDDDVDWPALRRWAAYCEEYPPGWSEPRYLCDLVLDVQRPAWETVLQICWAGGAAAVWKNGKLSVVYQYRDAHSDAGISVPAKAPVQLISSALCEEVQVRWLEKKGRATAYDFQFLDESQGYAQNVATVEDSEASINDPSDPNSEPYIVEVVQAYGVTRRSQLVRQGVQMHRSTRLVRRELTFTCGPWMLAAEVGDLIDFQHDLLRPFDDAVATVVQVVSGALSSLQVTVDHAVPVTSPMPWFAARTADGSPFYRQVHLITATTYRGRPASVLTFQGTGFTVASGASAFIGEADKLVETYQVVAISLAQDMRRVVRCLQWVPEVWDAVPPSLADLGQTGATLKQKVVQAVDVQATDLQLERAIDGRYRVTWSRPSGDTGRTARVYAQDATVGVWVLVGETGGTALNFAWKPGSADLRIAVAVESSTGSFEAPDVAAQSVAPVPEFPAVVLPAPADVQVLQSPSDNRLELRWTGSSAADVAEYEVRAGDHWDSGLVIYRGREPRAQLHPAPALPTLQVAARHIAGLYGRRRIVDAPVQALPYSGASVLGSFEYAPNDDHLPTLSGCKWTSPFFELSPGVYHGTLTSLEHDLGFEAPWFVRVACSWRSLDGATVADVVDVPAGSGEAFWRTLDGRPASPMHPGIEWSLEVADVDAQSIESLDALTAGGLRRGESGSHTSCRLESRVYAGGSWSAWHTHADRLVVCSAIQVRCMLGRSSIAREVRLETLRVEALI